MQRMLSGSVTSENKWRYYLLEWAIIVLIAYAYCASTLLDFNSMQLQQTGEQNNNAIGAILAETSVLQNGQVPLWNPFLMTGFPQAGDLNDHFWSPIATLPVLIWGAINGMKVSVFLGFIIAGLGQWYLAKICGVRGIFRVWSSITFMLSGGLALFWRVGWVYLFLGAVWFPWVFASFWVALHKRSWSSLIFCAFTVAMPFLTGGGYFPFYLFATAATILVVAYLTSKPEIRKAMLPRAIIIAAIAAGMIAVMLVPDIGSLKLINRVTGPDVVQNGSQPILYALMNYLIAVPEWRDANILGTANGWNWFYLGPLSILGLLFLYPAFHNRRYRPALIAMVSITALMLLWEANRFIPVKYLYDWFPFLYTLRFPNRLLVIAASPLLIVAALSFQWIYYRLRKWARQFALHIGNSKNNTVMHINSSILVTLSFLVIFILSVRDTYLVNKPVAFGAHTVDLTSFKALGWLKAYDPGTYYVDLGGGLYFWSWDPAAYELQLPILNDNQVERLDSSYQQVSDSSTLVATAKYQFLQTNQTPGPGAELITEIDGYQLWYYPDALPFAFSVPENAIGAGSALDKTQVTSVQAAYQGLNHITAVADSDGTNNRLVVLVSNYPGWKVSVDGKPYSLSVINSYLGVQLLPGRHTYTFAFDPPLHYLGLAITLFTLWLCLSIMLFENLSPYLLKTVKVWNANKLPVLKKYRIKEN